MIPVIPRLLGLFVAAYLAGLLAVFVAVLFWFILIPMAYAAVLWALEWIRIIFTWGGENFGLFFGVFLVGALYGGKWFWEVTEDDRHRDNDVGLGG